MRQKERRTERAENNLVSFKAFSDGVGGKRNVSLAVLL